MSYLQILKEANEKAVAISGELFDDISLFIENPDVDEKYADYVVTVARYILILKEYYELHNSGKFASLSIEDMQDWNKKLYSPVYEENYATCYANPEYAVKVFGEAGVYLASVYADILTAPKSAALNQYYYIVRKAMLFVQVRALLSENANVTADELKAVLKSDCDNSVELNAKIRTAGMVDPEYGVVTSIIKTADLTDLRYLYRLGVHVTQNELDVAAFINSLTEEEVKAMAYTFTNGYLVGYAKLGVDIHKKNAVAVYHVAGFERMIKYVIQNMEKEGLKIVLSYVATTEANRQFGYDYKSSLSLCLDEAYLKNYVAAAKTAFEEQKANANGFAGPLALETFGEKEFQPVNKKEALNFSDEQQKLMVQLQNEGAMLRSQYIIPEERSFAIISYPIPAIGDNFKEVFAATVKVNTLDYKTYETIQQKLIDALDQADTVHIKGIGDNKTDLTVKVYNLEDPTKQSAFENCVADVNIPVGEVFTSPVLKGTNGILNVGKVYLDGMLVKDLVIELNDGMIAKCTCGNFETEEDNKKYLDDLIMFHHDTLPIGEFAIGTNTTAYKMGIDYDVQDKLPVLIAEKTGPHFAMGDTCYSRSEDIKVFNPDGKEIIARDNEVSLLRKEDPSKAYFNCHTDITIPYNELDSIIVNKKDGSTISLIEKGRFVLEGTQELNKPLIELYGE